MSGEITAVIGWSERADAQGAGREAAEQALKQLPGSIEPKLALVFGSSWFNQALLLQGVHAVLGPLPMAGESTAGEIVPSGPITHSCAILLLASDALTCAVGMGVGADRAPREAGVQAARTAMRQLSGSQRTGCVFFSDGLATGQEDIVRGIQEALGTSSLIVGGMAGDDFRFVQTHQYANYYAVSDAVVAVLFGGDLKIGVGMEHGFAPISKPRRITRSRGNILYELDRQPAVSVYEEYFGPEVIQRMKQGGSVRHGIAYPLGIQPESSDGWLLRNVLSFSEDGSLACSGEIMEGAWLQLMLGNKELALEAAGRAAQAAVQSLNRIGCAVVFDSAIRRTFFGSEHAAREIARIREIVGASTPLIGCYTYSEEGPFGTAPAPERTVLQTGSVLVVAIGA